MSRYIGESPRGHSLRNQGASKSHRLAPQSERRGGVARHRRRLVPPLHLQDRPKQTAHPQRQHRQLHGVAGARPHRELHLLASLFRRQLDQFDEPERGPQPVGGIAPSSGQIGQFGGHVVARKSPPFIASRNRHLRTAPRTRRERQQITSFAVYANEPQPEGALVGREPGQAHAQLPDGLRREHRGAGVDLLLATANGVSQRRNER